MSADHDRRYELVVARPYLCVAAAIEMVCRFERIRTGGQEEVAKELGAVVPDDARVGDGRGQPAGDAREWGIRLDPGLLNQFFAAREIPLRARFIPAATLDEVGLKLSVDEALLQGRHVLCGFSYHALRGLGEPEEGHVVVVLGIGDHDTCRVIDPGPRDAGTKVLDAVDLLAAARRREGGLLIVEHLVAEGQSH